MSCALSGTASSLLKCHSTRSIPIRSLFSSSISSYVVSRASVRRGPPKPCEVSQLRSLNTPAISKFQQCLRCREQACALHTSSAKLARQPSRRNEPAPQRGRTPPGRGPRQFIRSVRGDELLKIFECDVSEDEGNTILRTLHRRRVEGSLLELGVQLNAHTSVPTESLMKALNFLREKYPMDEQAAAQAWAQQETAKIEQEYIARAEKLGIYKPLDGQKGSGESDAGILNTGRSVIEEFKKHHAERRAKEAAEKEASGEAAREHEMALAKQVEREQREVVLQERRAMQQEKGKVSQMKGIPDMTKTQRLLSSTVFACILLLSCYYVVGLYTPPASSQRLFPELPPSVATALGCLAINGLIFVMWKMPVFWRTLNTYFTVSPAWPFAVSMAGNAISHRTLLHLSANMVAVFLYGVPLHEDIGRGNWVALYLAGGVFGSVCSLWYCVLVNKLYTLHYGASGAVWAIMASWAYLNAQKPAKDTGSWAFLYDVCLWATLGIQVFAHCSPTIMTRVDVPAHAAGALLGLASAWGLKTRAEAHKLLLLLEEEEGSSVPSS